MAASAPVYNAKKAWLVAIVVIIVATFAGIVTFRQMTVVPLLTAYFGVGIAEYGNVSAIVSLFTLVGALASGPIQAKFGPRKLMIWCVILFFISTLLQVICAYAGSSFEVFMFANLFGTLAYGAWMTAPPIVISMWFPSEKRGLPNSIAATWISFAMLIVLTVSNPLVALGGGDANPLAWVNIWWFLLILMAVGFVLLLVFAKMPGAENNFLEKQDPNAPKAKMSDGLKNGGCWMLMLLFIAFGFGTAAFGNYFPTFAADDPTMGGLGMSLADANAATSVSSYVMVIFGFVWGFILNVIPNKHYDILNLVVIILTGVAGCMMFVLPGVGAVIPFMVFWGLVSRLFPPVCFTIVPEISSSMAEASVITGLLSLVSNLVGTAATAIVGNCAAAGWGTALMPNIVVTIIGIVAAVILIPIYRKKFAARHANDEVAA